MFSFLWYLGWWGGKCAMVSQYIIFHFPLISFFLSKICGNRFWLCVAAVRCWAKQFCENLRNFLFTTKMFHLLLLCDALYFFPNVFKVFAGVYISTCGLSLMRIFLDVFWCKGLKWLKEKLSMGKNWCHWRRLKFSEFIEKAKLRLNKFKNLGQVRGEHDELGSSKYLFFIFFSMFL